MNKIIYFLIFLAISQYAVAQDTLRSQDFAAAGDTFVISIGSSFTGMDPAATGANFTWDFSELGRSSQRIDTFFDPASTNALLAFVFINSPFNANRANLATRGQNFNLGAVGLSDVFNYYYNSSSEYSQPGFGAVVNGIPIPVTYSPHDIIYHFPLTFNDEDSVSYHYELDLTSTVGFYYYVTRKRHNLVDGWGTLSTPFGTFDVIRMKSTIVEQDSFYVDTLHLGLNLPPVTTFEYKWMTRGFGVPMLQINTSATNTVSSIIYPDSIHMTGINEELQIVSSATVYPNPASDFLFVKYELLKNSDVKFRLDGIDGREVFVTEKKNQSPGENMFVIGLKEYNLSEWNYLLQIESGKYRSSHRIEIRK
jgi:hypothetical protein